jgi:phage uncharacterized protein, XkdX family
MNWYKMIKRYYDMGKYTNEQMEVFVRGNKITEEQYEEITGVKYPNKETVEETETTEE